MDRKEYKNSMSGVRPSEQLVERIMDMTYDKKTDKKMIFKRAASCVLALAVLVGGGFGINCAVKKGNDDLSVIIAYADETMSVKGLNKQKIFYGLYFAPIDDAEKNEEQYAKAQDDYDEITKDFEKVVAEEGGFAAKKGISKYDLYDEVSGEYTAMIYKTGSGFFAVNKTDYDNVESFTVENESKYGIIDFECAKTFEILESIARNEDKYTIDENDPYGVFQGHKFTLTGDELRHSQKNFNGDRGYTVEWETSNVLESEIAANLDFDITRIKDRITFTFKYTDGTVESASVNIGFDSNGHMVLSDD